MSLPDLTPASTLWLVERFYEKVRQDQVLAPYFSEVDWERHLPRLAAFWEKLLFGSGVYEGRPLLAHFQLHAKKPLTLEAMETWWALFEGTLTEHFVGPVAIEAKTRARNIGVTIIREVMTFKQPNP